VILDPKEIAVALADAQVILHRPDSIWGLSCDATQEAAVARIDSIKQRKGGKSYVVLVKDDAMLERYVKEVPEVAWDLIDAAVSPMTIIYPQGLGLAPSICAPDGSVAIRVTQDKLTRDIIHHLRKPIVSTSANLSGCPAPRTLSQVDEAISSSVELIIARNQELAESKPSTIIKLSLNGEFKIIRS